MIKIVKDDQKKLYELTYLLPAFFTSAEASKHKAAVLDLVKKHGGDLQAEEDWGKRDLAYKIKKDSKIHSDAVYTHLRVIFSPTKVQKFEKDLRLMDSLLRFLLVVAIEEAATEEKKTSEKK